MSLSSSSTRIDTPFAEASCSNVVANSVFDDLSTLIYHELGFVEKSFTAAKINMDQVLTQISDARHKFDQLLESIYGAGSMISKEAELDRLQQLKVEVSDLKSKIPYNLVNLSSSTAGVDQKSRPRFDSRHGADPAPSTGTTLMENLGGNPKFHVGHHEVPPPTFEELSMILYTLHSSSMELLRCYMSFPDNAVVKRTLLYNWWLVYWTPLSSDWKNLDESIAPLVAKGCIKPVYKKSNMSLTSYWMHPSVRSSLKRTNHTWFNHTVYLAPSPTDEKDVLYSDPNLVKSMRKLKILHLGKWHRSLSRTQHIEVTDPDMFFKGIENLTALTGVSMITELPQFIAKLKKLSILDHGSSNLTALRYVSLQGISMITNLPRFITKLKCLEVLDLKACHNLETIPNDINNLWRTLTHLDMSECYYLDHMPVTISGLLNLKVLKGFFVKEPVAKSYSCTVRDLTKLTRLEKLNIYTRVEEFPSAEQLEDLSRLTCLRNLTVSWGGCRTHKTRSNPRLSSKDSIGGKLPFLFMLEKLDLQCVPETVTRVWLNPSVFVTLKKLYIRGGQFFDLGQKLEEPREETRSVYAEEKWTVEILRLKYLSKLKMDWSDVANLFPKLISLEKVECPNLTNFPCDENGLWCEDSTRMPSTTSLSFSFLY